MDPKLILNDEQVEAMAEALPMLRDAMCSGETSDRGHSCESCLSVGFNPQSTYSSSIRRIKVHFSNFKSY